MAVQTAFVPVSRVNFQRRGDRFSLSVVKIAMLDFTKSQIHIYRGLMEKAADRSEFFHVERWEANLFGILIKLESN